MEGEHNDEQGDNEYHWPALESDPEIFTNYMTKLGMSKCCNQFRDY